MVKISVNSPGMTLKRLKQMWDRQVSPKLADTILGDCNTYVRMQDGTLAESARVEENGKCVTWNTKYAKRVYYTGTPRTNRNPLASLQWCEKAKGEHAADWARAAEEMLKG